MGETKKGMESEGGVEFRGPRLCGVPSERGFFFQADSQGLHPGLVCDAPTRAWDRNAIVQIAPTGQRIPGRASPWELQIALKGAMHTSPGCQPWEPHPRE
jgi:hypothetical protein